jgi:CheY-like chemotaxis protein
VKPDDGKWRLQLSSTSISNGDFSCDTVPHGDSPVQGHARCILCVDDEVLGTSMRADILREHGYSVVVYHSPLEATRCDLSMFNLAILDFEMPGLNGRQLFMRIRAMGGRFPIVLLTGCLEALSREDRSLFSRCLDKAMPMHYLLDTIAEFLDPNQIPDFGS